MKAVAATFYQGHKPEGYQKHVIWWSMDEILNARIALATIFKWKRESDAGFDVVYGLATPDSFGWNDCRHLMVPREFCDKFHNPRHLPVIPNKVKYVPASGPQPDGWCVYVLNRYFSNGYASYLPVKWWDREEEVVESFSTYGYALDHQYFLGECGKEASVRWNDTDRVWDVCYNGRK